MYSLTRRSQGRCGLYRVGHICLSKNALRAELDGSFPAGSAGLMLASGALLGWWQRRQKIAKMSQRRRARCCGAALKIPKKLRAFGIIVQKIGG